jgi:hypothetical protein
MKRMKLERYVLEIYDRKIAAFQRNLTAAKIKIGGDLLYISR